MKKGWSVGATIFMNSFSKIHSQHFIAIDGRATGLRSFIKDTTDFFATGIMQDLFQIVGIEHVLKRRLKIIVKIRAS